jgi:hypothetical protein
MDINVTDGTAMDRRNLPQDEALAQVSLSRQPRQWISSRGPECHSGGRVARQLRGGFSMIKRWTNPVTPFASLVLMSGALLAFAGCESKGPAEKAGESVDKGIQSAKDIVNPPGAGEKAGRNLDKALKP